MKPSKELEAALTGQAEAVLALAGYDLVQVNLLGGARFLTVQVLAERADARPMTVNDCARVCQLLAQPLDSIPDLANRYTLEVSSPGVDRPLVRVKDFERYTGHVARIELQAPLDRGQGRERHFQGSIVRVTGANANAEIEFHTEAGELRVPLHSISRARLVMTDALLNATGDSAQS